MCVYVYLCVRLSVYMRVFACVCGCVCVCVCMNVRPHLHVQYTPVHIKHFFFPVHLFFLFPTALSLTHTQLHARTPTHVRSTHSLTQACTDTRRHRCTCTCTYTNTYTIHTHRFTRTRTRTRSQHSRTRTHTHTNAHTLHIHIRAYYISPREFLLRTLKEQQCV